MDNLYLAHRICRRQTLYYEANQPMSRIEIAELAEAGEFRRV